MNYRSTIGLSMALSVTALAQDAAVKEADAPAKQTAAKLAEEVIFVKGAGSCESMTLVDLDGDGLKDLVSGVPNGTVLFYKNSGTAQKPAFGVGVPLSDSAKQLEKIKIPHW